MKAKIRTKLRKKDTVMVISGKYKGKKGKVLDINHVKNRVLIEGINLVKKTMKKTQENPKGGILEKEAHLHLSNVMYFDASSNKPVRLGYRLSKESKKKERCMKNKEKKII